jgi:hypothetical protein
VKIESKEPQLETVVEEIEVPPKPTPDDTSPAETAATIAISPSVCNALFPEIALMPRRPSCVEVSLCETLIGEWRKEEAEVIAVGGRSSSTSRCVAKACVNKEADLVLTGAAHRGLLCWSPSREILVPSLGLLTEPGTAFADSGGVLDMRRTSNSSPGAMWEFDWEVLGVNGTSWIMGDETRGGEGSKLGQRLRVPGAQTGRTRSLGS